MAVESTFDPLPRDLAQRLTEGATVILHGLTPKNLARWGKILPAGIELKKADAIHAVRKAPHPALAGVSASDLWWSRFIPWERKEQGPVAVAYSVKPAEGTKNLRELVAPGALTAVSVGKGTLLIDQLLWEKKDVHQDRSGQYAALLLENLIRRNGRP